MNKHFFRNLFYVIPLLIIIPILMLIHNTVSHVEEVAYNNAWQEKVKEIRIFANRADFMLQNNITLDRYKELYHTIVTMQMEEMDKDYGTFAVAMDKNLNIITKRHYDDEQDGDPMQIPAFRGAIYLALGTEKKGFIDVEWKGEIHQLYFQSIPLADTEYWVIIGLGKDRIIEQLDMKSLTIPLFVVGFVLMLAVEDSVFLRLKQGKQEIKSKK